MAIPMITGFEEKDLPVINEALRKISSSISNTRLLVWYIKGDLATGTEKGARITIPFPCTCVKASAHVKTAPTGHTLDIDINADGTSLLGSVLSVAISGTDASKTVSTNITANQYITMDIDDIGSTVAGADLTVQLEVTT